MFNFFRRLVISISVPESFRTKIKNNYNEALSKKS